MELHAHRSVSFLPTRPSSFSVSWALWSFFDLSNLNVRMLQIEREGRLTQQVIDSLFNVVVIMPQGVFNFLVRYRYIVTENISYFDGS